LYYCVGILNKIKSLIISILTLELITAVASNGDMEEMYPNASIAGVEGYLLPFEMTFNNETIPPVVTIIFEIYIITYDTWVYFIMIR